MPLAIHAVLCSGAVHILKITRHSTVKSVSSPPLAPSSSCMIYCTWWWHYRHRDAVHLLFVLVFNSMMQSMLLVNKKQSCSVSSGNDSVPHCIYRLFAHRASQKRLRVEMSRTQSIKPPRGINNPAFPAAKKRCHMHVENEN